MTSADDGCTGTNFDRPGFRRMIADIEAGRVDCVVVKDLSRFGRDYIDVGFYLERCFPAKGVRFIAINDGVDSGGGAYDMLLPVRNVFNAQYARDISEKVKSAFRAKQRRGEFCGAFASYGYLKDPRNSDHLIADPVAAEVVRRSFAMAAEGIKKQAIADAFNKEGIPCPLEYKRLMGAKYHIGGRRQKPRQWTYAAVHRILHNEMYIGSMVANKTARRRMHGKAKANDRSEWIVVEGTHEPIISRELWDTVQRLTNKNARAADAAGHGGLFTGFLRCAECGSTLVKITWNKKTAYSCGGYHRRGAAACTGHFIPEEDLIGLVLRDLNRIVGGVRDLERVAEEAVAAGAETERRGEGRRQLEAAIERVRALKRGTCEDHRDGLLGGEEYRRYHADYDAREAALARQLAWTEERAETGAPSKSGWTAELLRLGRLTELDRATVAQTIDVIRVFEDKHIEIRYRFSEQPGASLRGKP